MTAQKTLAASIALLVIFISCKRDPAPDQTVRQDSKHAGPAPGGSTSSTTALAPTPKARTLTIAYSDWPGWVAWDIAVEKGFFREAGVEVKLDWLEYVPSMEAFSQGKSDAVCMTNGDALVSASSGAQGVGIVVNDYSNGNDMVVARAGVKSMADLKGKKVAVEVGFVDHLLLLEGLKTVGLTESDVDIVNEKTHKLPELLKAGAVSAIAAWQPNSGQALDQVPGSAAIYTSANSPGLIYDLLFVNPKSLAERRADWKKVVLVWFRIADYIRDPATRADAVRIMSARVKLSPEKYARLLEGTFILGRDGNKKHFVKGTTFESVYGSSQAVDKFNVANRIYKDAANVDAGLDPSLLAELDATK